MGATMGHASRTARAGTSRARGRWPWRSRSSCTASRSQPRRADFQRTARGMAGCSCSVSANDRLVCTAMSDPHPMPASYLIQEYNRGRRDFHSIYMQGANLSAAELSGIDLHSAKLLGCNLSDANLSKACLQGTDLRQTDLTETTLTGARFSNTTKWPAGFIPPSSLTE